MFIEAAENIGIPRASDFNRGDQTGVGYIQQTTYNGLRCSTAVAYLRPARKRANLAIVTNAHVERVIFEGKRAVGVAYRTRKGPRRAVRSEEHTSELQSLMRIPYAVFCLKKKKNAPQCQ